MERPASRMSVLCYCLVSLALSGAMGCSGTPSAQDDLGASSTPLAQRPDGPQAPAAVTAHSPSSPATLGQGIHHGAPGQVVEVGRSVRGTPIVLEVFGQGHRPIFIVGGIHGNEPAGAEVARRLSLHLREHPEAFAGTTVGVLAAANPDGLARGTRGNERDVDINRNFPAKNWAAREKSQRKAGVETPAGEPETQAILAAMDRVKPERIVSIHVWAPGNDRFINYDGPAEALAGVMAQKNGYKITPVMRYRTPGSLGNWAGVDRSIPIVTLELPMKPADQCWQENREALLAAIRDGVPRPENDLAGTTAK